MMCVMPSYQRRGLGERLVNWGQREAEKEGKRVFLTATPEGRELYREKCGFEEEGAVTVNLGDYDGVGDYTQTVMVWSGIRRQL